MHRRFVLACSLLIAVTGTPVFGGLLERFEAKAHKSPAGGELLYRQLDPAKIAPGKKYPLILLLHGAGGRGSDNTRQLTDAGVIKLLEKINFVDNYPCFVLAPQVPHKKRWVEVHWGLDAHTMPTKPGDQMRMALELVDGFVKTHPIDTSRIYVTGLSMGGFGTWDAIQRRPGFFAAAVPVCGGGDTAEAAKLTKTPIWAFHGGRDKVVKTKRSRDMIAAIKTAGGNPRYTEFPNVGHNAWTQAYGNQQTWAWMFKHARGTKGDDPPQAAKPIEGPVRVACLGDSITFGAGVKDRKNNAYPVQLGRLLGKQWEVRNFGHSGRTMLKKGDHPIWREKAYSEALAFKPHVVVIKLGTNDTKPQNWKHKDEFDDDTAAMVDAFAALPTQPKIFLCRPVPAFPERWGIRDSVIRQEVIPMIDRVAKDKGVGVIDLYKALEGRKDLFPDKIHPNAAGAKVMAETIAPILKRHVHPN